MTRTETAGEPGFASIRNRPSLRRTGALQRAGHVLQS